MIMYFPDLAKIETRDKMFISISCCQDIDRKNEQTAAILKMQGVQLAELEILYKEEQVLRKRYYNTIEGNVMTM